MMRTMAKRRRDRGWLAQFIGACALLTGVWLAPAPVSASDAEPPLAAQLESELIRGLEQITRGRLEDALTTFSDLIRREPEFKLAQMIFGDLQTARFAPLTGPGMGKGAAGAKADAVAGLLAEARARLKHIRSRPGRDHLPEQLLQLGPDEDRVVVIDLTASRLYLFENRDGVPRLAADYYISSGKNGPDKVREGDKKTPLGVYRITGYIPNNRLPDFYGAGALPIDYPNAWDKKRDKTGYGIWLHGTPIGAYSRPPLASDGCVALTNRDFNRLDRQVSPGAPVVITNRVAWLPPKEWRARQEGVLALLDAEGGAGRKLSDLSILGYYGSDEAIMVVSSVGPEKSGEEGRTRWVDQYWRWEVDRWVIVFDTAPGHRSG